jgi:hypothetical protein
MCSGGARRPGWAAPQGFGRQNDPDPHAAPQYTNSGACVALFAPGTEIASACGGARARPFSFRRPSGSLLGSQRRPQRRPP